MILTKKNFLNRFLAKEDTQEVVWCKLKIINNINT